jgi:hypothetical protein
MTDWADEIAYAMTMAWYEIGGTEFEVNEADIAALRKARSDALEEAATRLDREWPGPASEIVRALKDKQP